MFLARATYLIAKNKFKATKTDNVESILHMRVMPHECEVTMVNNSVYLNYFELGRIDLMTSSPYYWKSLKKKWAGPMKSIQVQYIKPLRRLDKFSVHTKMLGHDEKFFYIGHSMKRKGEFVAIAVVQAVIKEGRKTIPPEMAMEVMGMRFEPLSGWENARDGFKNFDQNLPRLKEIFS